MGEKKMSLSKRLSKRLSQIVKKKENDLESIAITFRTIPFSQLKLIQNALVENENYGSWRPPVLGIYEGAHVEIIDEKGSLVTIKYPQTEEIKTVEGRKGQAGAQTGAAASAAGKEGAGL